MPLLRGFWEAADFWSPEARSERGRTGLHAEAPRTHALGSQPLSTENVGTLPPSMPHQGAPGSLGNAPFQGPLQLFGIRKSGVAEKSGHFKE